MKIQHIRHATFQVMLSGKVFLVDPMLSKAGEMDPTPSPDNNNRNPLVDLPKGLLNFDNIDAIIVTHTHRDHFDPAASELIPKQIPLFCQPADQQFFKDQGFHHIQAITEEYTWENIKITRTIARHGKGEMEEKMGPVSGFVIRAENEPVLYITGDTVWCSDVEDVLKKEKPDVTIAFAGAAEFPTGGPITLTKEDIKQICQTQPNTKVVAVHMDAWNHCLLKREELSEFISHHELSQQVIIPKDGEEMTFS